MINDSKRSPNAIMKIIERLHSKPIIGLFAGPNGIEAQEQILYDYKDRAKNMPWRKKVLWQQ